VLKIDKLGSPIKKNRCTNYQAMSVVRRSIGDNYFILLNALYSDNYEFYKVTFGLINFIDNIGMQVNLRTNGHGQRMVGIVTSSIIGLRVNMNQQKINNLTLH
jgi:hypothetical protein